MQRNLVLLTIPPAIALALLFLFDESNPSQQLPKRNPELTKQIATHDNQQDTRLAGQNQTAFDESISSNATLDGHNISDVSNSAIAQIQAIKEKTALHEAVLNDHQTFTRYPSQNVRFERNDRDPIEMIYTPQQRSNLSDDGTASITAWTDKKYILTGDTLTVFAKLNDQTNQQLQSKVLMEVFFNEQTSLGTFQMTALNDVGDYRFTLGPSNISNWEPGIYKALIVSDYKQLHEAVSFTVSPPVIRLTGEYREQVTNNGDLLFSLQVETTETARYYVRASLYTQSGAPVGSSEYGQSLDAGQHWIPLSYSGRLLHDAAENGPFEVRTVELAKTGIPMLRMPPASAGYWSESYPLEQFSQATFQEQQLLGQN